jgi:uncharacterized membrane protein YkvA (DUF1232 family)
MKKIFSILGLCLGIVYLLNPGSGVIEFIPDNIPVIGNLDEAGAVLLVLKCLGDLGFVLGKKK